MKANTTIFVVMEKKKYGTELSKKWKLQIWLQLLSMEVAINDVVINRGSWGRKIGYFFYWEYNGPQVVFANIIEQFTNICKEFRSGKVLDTSAGQRSKTHGKCFKRMDAVQCPQATTLSTSLARFELHWASVGWIETQDKKILLIKNRLKCMEWNTPRCD